MKKLLRKLFGQKPYNIVRFYPTRRSQFKICRCQHFYFDHRVNLFGLGECRDCYCPKFELFRPEPIKGQ